MTDVSPIIHAEHRPSLSEMRRIAPPGEAAMVEAAFAEAIALEAAGPRITPKEALAGRTGYAADFLGSFAVDLPRPKSKTKAADILPVDGQSDGRLDYMHFSVVMSKSRRMAMFTAVNMSGQESVSIPRDGDDKWFLDGRIPVEAQIGEALYAGNRLDRGHLVRREDPNWGDDARVANFDTFHFTNCAPQMDAFNQKTWLGLESYILKNARAWKERCTVFTGPHFTRDDLDYRGVHIPRAFWKVIAFLSDDGKPSATAYVVKQETELGMLEAAFGAYKTYQRSVASIEKLSGLSFGNLAQYDGFSNEEGDLGVEISAELRSLADVRV